MIIKNNSLEVLRMCNYVRNEKLNAFVSDNLYLSIVATNKCQCNCPYCINSATDTTLELPFHKAKENIRKAIEEFGVKEAVILGGEPTLYPHLFELIEFLKKQGLRRVGITTNGIKLKDKQFFEDLLWTGVNFINISFHNENFLKWSELREIRDVFCLKYNTNQKMRINTNVWKGNNDNLRDLSVFLGLLQSYCDEIRVSNLIKKDNFSVNEINLPDAEKMYLQDWEYWDLFTELIKYYERGFTVIYNPAALGFVDYFLIPTKTPIIINRNINSRVSEQICENDLGKNRIHTIKCLVTGDLSLSWNLNNKI